MRNLDKLVNKYLFGTSLFLVLINMSSCGFVYVEHVTNNYYIIGVDNSEDLGLSYKLSSGDYIGKAPGRLLWYGFNDTFLVAKTQEYNNREPSYYIIDMTKDSELAHEESFRIGPLTGKVFLQSWEKRLNIQLKDIK